MPATPASTTAKPAANNSRTFADLGVPRQLVKAMARAGISTPTAVQSAVIPDAIAGANVLGRATTGSGKTLAFGLPILARLSGGRSQPKSPRALIIVPTRELANQVRASLEPLGHVLGLKVMAVYGGTPYDRQIKRLRSGVDVVVATPGRLDDLIKRGTCRLDRVEVTVLDEADHLCDLGFFPTVSALVGKTPAGGQRMLLSATLDGDVDRLVRTHLVDPVSHDCDPDQGQPDLTHHVLVTAGTDKISSIVSLLAANPRSIVFTRTRRGASNLANKLAAHGVASVDLHGSLSQRARERNLRKFRSGEAEVVVATDVAARGIHVDGVSLVVHYDAPSEHKAYLHRSGRTARAGSSGSVVTMTTPHEVRSVMRLQRAAGVSALHHDIQTAPQPMTVAALAGSGRPADSVKVPADSGRSTGASGARRGRRHDARPGSAGSARGRGGTGSRGRYADRGRPRARSGKTGR